MARPRPFDPEEWPYRTSGELKMIERCLSLFESNPRSVLELGLNRMVHMEWDLAVPLLTDAAERTKDDYAEFAMSILATLHGQGLGVPKDAEKSLYWYERSGAFYGLNMESPRAIAKSIAGKQKMEVKVSRKMRDPNDSKRWEFSGTPSPNGMLYIEIDPTDIDGFVVPWSPMVQVSENNGALSHFEVHAICSVYFDVELYRKMCEKLDLELHG